MRRADALAALNRALLHAYSRATTAHLAATLPLRLVQPWLDRFLALNVAKEVRKDSLAIHRAAAALAAGGPPSAPAAVSELLAAGRAVDRAFLREIASLPVDILIRYEEIEAVRRQRIDRQLRAAHRILDAWRDAPDARAALRQAYPGDQLANLLHELMRLYAMETQALSRSLRLPLLLLPLREPLVAALAGSMNAAATAVTRRAVAAVRRRAGRASRSGG